METPVGPATVAPSGAFYRPNAPWLTSPVRYDLIVTVSAGDSADVLPLPLEIPAIAASGRPEAQSWWLRPFFGDNAEQSLAVIIAAFGAGIGLMVRQLYDSAEYPLRRRLVAIRGRVLSVRRAS